jgi:hypothetical protein
MNFAKKEILIRRTLSVAFCFFSVVTHAQEWPSDFWHDGKIILETGDTLKGLVKYDLQQDVLQYKRNDRQASGEAYSSRKVLSFEIFDGVSRKYRIFFALPFSNSGGYKTPVFFELLEEGKMTLLTREQLEYRTYSSPYYFGGSYSRLVLVYRFFFLDEKGNITEFLGKKNDLLARMGNKAEEVEKFMRVNRLDITDRNEMTRIVDYYNSLFE